MKKLFIFTFITIFFTAFLFINVKANEINLINGAKSGILIEESTGTILYEKNKDKKLSPASMTKIMTLLLIYEAMDEKLFTKDTILTASTYASKMGGSQVYLKEGEKISVDEALKCICIASANDCAVVLAEEISGTEEAFVMKMNKKAKDLGLKNTNFIDCTGLTSENHYTTAYDLAIISKELLTKYPDVKNYTTLKEDYIRKNTTSPFWLVNTNKMIGRVEGLNGLKTGYTSFSGYCITLSMTKENMNLISVVFGYDSSTTRNAESLELLRYGFNNYKRELVIKKGTVLENVDHILYKNSFNIIVDEDVFYLCKKNEKNDYEYHYSYKINDNNCDGNIDIYLNNQKISSSKIINDNEIKKRNIFELIIKIVKKCFV
ncbi:MAG: serine hydrolase [Anaeroplasma sp.]